MTLYIKISYEIDDYSVIQELSDELIGCAIELSFLVGIIKHGRSNSAIYKHSGLAVQEPLGVSFYFSREVSDTEEMIALSQIFDGYGRLASRRKAVSRYVIEYPKKIPYKLVKPYYADDDDED